MEGGVGGRVALTRWQMLNEKVHRCRCQLILATFPFIASIAINVVEKSEFLLSLRES
jgi:hypothetical protein